MSTSANSSNSAIAIPTIAPEIADNVKPRSAIVTGASRGIGRAIAIQLAEDGFDVALNSLPRSVDMLREVVQIIGQKGRKAIIVSGDVSNEDFVQELIDKTVSELGELYVMVANAGIIIPSLPAPVVDTPFSDWKRVLEVNLDGVFLCYRAAARQMLKQGSGGRIIGGSSTASKMGFPLFAHYSASKFGVRGLTQALAAELATSNITVNAYAPGPIATDIWKGMKMVGEGEKGGGDAFLEKFVETIPMKRSGSAEEVAGLVSYLVSDKASFITGQSVAINGGLYYD